MFREYIIQDNQNIYDIAIMIYGSVDGVSILKQDNPTVLPSIHTEVHRGDVLKIDSSKIINKSIGKFFTDRNVVISTGTVSKPDFNKDFNKDFNI